jgi:hypothetical protein
VLDRCPGRGLVVVDGLTADDGVAVMVVAVVVLVVITVLVLAGWWSP